MCCTLEVSRSGFYAWLKRQGSESPKQRRDRELTERILRIHAESRETYGSPRIHAVLQQAGEPCGLNRVVRLMRTVGIQSVVSKKFRVCTTDSNHSLPIAENLLDGNFCADCLNQVWLADITYIPTDEGWLYLASILDLCSRKVVGWSLQNTLRTELVLAALEMALGSRQPAAGLIHHSDRGSQYASEAYQKALEKHGLVCSMSGKGNCYDNAPKESFYHTLKTELVHRQHYRTHDEARTNIFEYIEVFYNRQRLHSSLGYKTPTEFENQVSRAA